MDEVIVQLVRKTDPVEAIAQKIAVELFKQKHRSPPWWNIKKRWKNKLRIDTLWEGFCATVKALDRDLDTEMDRAEDVVEEVLEQVRSSIENAQKVEVAMLN